MANNEKTTIYYRVVVGPNPNNKDEIIKRPVITRRETYSLSRVVKAAIDSGRIRGKFHDLTGVINGFMDEIKVLLEEGKSINANFMRLHAELTNQLGDSETITSANGLKTCVTPLSELKLDVDKFSWQRIDDNGIKLTLSTIKGEGCKLGQVIAAKKATINGRNLTLLEGDSVTAKCGDISANCEVLESDEDHIVIVVPEDFDLPELEKKDIVFTVKGRCGDEEGAFQSKTIRATLIADAPSEPTLTSFVQLNQAGVVEAVGKMLTIYDMIEVKGKNLPEGIKGRYALYDKDSGELKTATEWEANPSHTMFERVSSTTVRAQFKVNATPFPDGMWLDEGHPIKFEVKLPDESIISIDLPLA